MTWTAPPRWRAIRRAVFAAKGRSCHWCGQPANTVDHVVPVVLGGGHEMANLVPCCRRCNCRRGAQLTNSMRGQTSAWRTAREW